MALSTNEGDRYANITDTPTVILNGRGPRTNVLRIFVSSAVWFPFLYVHVLIVVVYQNWYLSVVILLSYFQAQESSLPQF